MPPKLNNNQIEERRPLSFPAVHPCEAISPSILLASLITLSQTICNFPSNTFPTQRRNARETARQISILHALFQDLRDRGSVIPYPVLLCFSELHVTFQKIHFLMQDCVREGTRLWMLVKSQHVSTQFRLLIRAMATALDVLPLQSIEICGEVKELVELVTRQARKTEFALDQNDERETKRLRFVLDQFERGTEPDLDAMKLVLNYLEIKSWSSCNKEIKFLEDERNSNEREFNLLSSLIGFSCYSRVIIFETLDFQSRTTEQHEARCNTETLSCVMPEDFRCPISLEIMTDPVTVSTGQTYNRASIQKWLKAGNTMCPKTGEKLTNTELFPNTSLKKLIQQFCSDNGISIANSTNLNRTITKTIEPGCPAAAHAMQYLSWFIASKLVFGTEEQKNKAAYEIRMLARSNIFNKACLVEMGTVPPLLDLLDTDDRITQENAIGALMKLSTHASGQQVIIDSRGLTPIIKVLKRGLSLEARHVAAATVFYLSSVKENRKLIGENPEAIPGLVELIKEGTTSGKKNAVVAIFGLLLLPKNHSKVVAAGAVQALVDVIASSDKADLVTDCLAVLVALAESGEGALAVLQAQVLSLVTGILKSATSRAGKEYCVAILLSLWVRFGVEVKGVLARDSSLMPSLYSLLTDGTPHAAKKARSLIQVLQDFNDKRSSGMEGSSVSQQRLVRLS
ncbi:U-box domain-containing protein 19-like [Abrus precatorius]|uniref:RING-type E3 ubiquitin transferase n=1 Tax=Abrus precatorius TaxID=3816 RepID=A0A8B8K622_ABRPR|nr:U-box domain-containing protein 19-like [Abrus precatorius]